MIIVSGHSHSITDPVVRFENVHKAYDADRLVVRDLNLDVVRGEFLTLLGPSGSGKTTTLMMLAGFEIPTRGEIFLNGRPTNRIPPHRRNIGMVFQNYALFPHMTIRENLAFPLEVRKVPKAEREQRIRAALDMVELSNFGDRLPAQLSGGQQQRVAVARALIFEPEIVVMDEPLGALDKRLREQLQYEIKALHRRLGLTIVYVTHDQSEALTMSDRVAVFEQGAIDQLSTPVELYDNPQTSFVADFIGENNKLAAIVENASGEGYMVRLEGGHTAIATSPHPLSTGDAVELSVRPERVQIQSGIHIGPMPVINGVVDDVVYLGDHVRIHLSLGKGGFLLIKRPNDGKAGRIALGTQLYVFWEKEDCRVRPRSLSGVHSLVR